jgi:hypothetical protein
MLINIKVSIIGLSTSLAIDDKFCLRVLQRITLIVLNGLSTPYRDMTSIAMQKRKKSFRLSKIFFSKICFLLFLRAIDRQIFSESFLLIATHTLCIYLLYLCSTHINCVSGSCSSGKKERKKKKKRKMLGFIVRNISASSS